MLCDSVTSSQSCQHLSKKKKRITGPGQEVGWSVIPQHQDCRFAPQSGHMKGSANECTDECNNRSMFLSLKSTGGGGEESVSTFPITCTKASKTHAPEGPCMLHNISLSERDKHLLPQLGPKVQNLKQSPLCSLLPQPTQIPLMAFSKSPHLPRGHDLQARPLHQPSHSVCFRGLHVITPHTPLAHSSYSKTV